MNLRKPSTKCETVFQLGLKIKLDIVSLSTFKQACTLICLIYLLSCYSKVKRESREKNVYFDKIKLSTIVTGMHYHPNRAFVLQLDSILNNVSTDSLIFRQTIDFVTEPVSDPNSVFRNEIIYEKLLCAEFNSKWYGQEEKKRIDSKLHLLQQNDVGKLANDFTYITPDERRRTLYKLNCKYILLFFYNPECDACKEMKSSISRSAVINSQVEEGKLLVVAIYIDKDTAIWRSHLSEFPRRWIHGKDEGEYLYKNQVYDLRAIPTVYLLDSNKYVLLKDCLSIEEIENKIKE